jgi:hypothetical protein
MYMFLHSTIKQRLPLRATRQMDCVRREVALSRVSDNKINKGIVEARSTSKGIKLINKKLEELGAQNIETKSIEKEIKSVEEPS